MTTENNLTLSDSELMYIKESLILYEKHILSYEEDCVEQLKENLFLYRNILNLRYKISFEIDEKWDLYQKEIN